MMNPSAISRCTAMKRDGGFCDQTSMADTPFPICPHHAFKLYRSLHDLVMSGNRHTSLPVDVDELEEIRRQSSEQARADQASIKPVVYYLMTDGLVKIGFTTNLDRRLRQYPPTVRLLATEPGDPLREAQRHREFNEYLTNGREWFTPGPRLRAHIESLEDYRAA